MEQSQSIYDRCDSSYTQSQRRTLWGCFLDTRSPSTMSPPTSNYTYVSHPENHKLEHPTTHFNKLHQLLQQFLVINAMPSKHTFTTHHPIIYAQLQYLDEQYIPAVLQTSDNHTLMNANISLWDVVCHWHLIPPPKINHPQYPAYNLAEHHSLVVTIPDHHIQYLQLIFNKLTKPYDLTSSTIRPANKHRHDTAR